MRAFIASVSVGFLLIFVTAAWIGNCSALAQDADKEKETTTSFWMQRKMTYAQEILRGLASADYEAIRTNARQMRTLSKVEGFVRSRHANYRLQLQAFERVCDEMIQNAKEKNLSGVTQAFNQMTVSCVNCHQSMRAGPGEQEGNAAPNDVESSKQAD